MFNKKVQGNKGFTLIEILVVIGLIAILAAIVLIAINPARQFAQARNAQRNSDANAILNTIGQYMADNKGALPSGIDGTLRNIQKSEGNFVDLCSTIVPTYISALPTDPKLPTGAITDCTSAYTTDYTVQIINNRVQVCAPDAPLETAITPAVTICVTR